LLAGLAGSGAGALANEAAPIAAAAASAVAPAAAAPASASERTAAGDAPGPSEEEILAARPLEFGQFCLFAGTPPSDFPFTVIKKLKVGKQTYGSVKDVLPELVEQARSAGADAIVSYNGSQRFGFFPWRLVRPVATGTAVKWNVPALKDCKALGGTTVAEVLIANKPPAR
jgi:hypothetical protein